MGLFIAIVLYKSQVSKEWAEQMMSEVPECIKSKCQLGPEVSRDVLNNPVWFSHKSTMFFVLF